METLWAEPKCKWENAAKSWHVYTRFPWFSPIFPIKNLSKIPISCLKNELKLEKPWKPNGYLNGPDTRRPPFYAFPARIFGVFGDRNVWNSVLSSECFLMFPRKLFRLVLLRFVFLFVKKSSCSFYLFSIHLILFWVNLLFKWRVSNVFFPLSNWILESLARFLNSALRIWQKAHKQSEVS